MFPANKLAAAYPNTGFASATPNTVNFNILQPAFDLSNVSTTSTQANQISSHKSFAVSGRFTDPNLDQMVYASYDDSDTDNGPPAIALVFWVFSSKKPRNAACGHSATWSR